MINIFVNPTLKKFVRFIYYYFFHKIFKCKETYIVGGEKIVKIAPLEERCMTSDNEVRKRLRKKYEGSGISETTIDFLVEEDLKFEIAQTTGEIVIV